MARTVLLESVVEVADLQAELERIMRRRDELSTELSRFDTIITAKQAIIDQKIVALKTEAKK